MTGSQGKCTQFSYCRAKVSYIFKMKSYLDSSHIRKTKLSNHVLHFVLTSAFFTSSELVIALVAL